MSVPVKIFDTTMREVGEEPLPDQVFGVPANRALVHEAVRHYLSVPRAGTHDTKTRAEVSGAGRKLWRQKKTGRARIGSLRSPLWRHGGTVHGPTPRSYEYDFPKRKRTGALRAALSEKIREGRVILLASLEVSTHKTKDLAKVLDTLGVQTGALILDEPLERNLELAARNLPHCKLARASNVNVVDLIKYDKLVLTTAAAKRLSEVLA